MNRFAPLALILCFACALPPAADPEFSDAASFTFLQFDSEQPADLAFAMRALEQELYLAVDIDAEDAEDRALSPASLTDADLEALPDRPDRPAENLRSVTVIKPSLHGTADHQGYILLDDQVPVEPSSPNHYDRTFGDGIDCWPTQGCEFLRTENLLTKENIAIGEITYTLFKDYRWIDLNLPDPSSVPEGETPVNDGDKRWGLAARSWTDEVAFNPAGDRSIQQSFSIEVWIPRDGAGYVRSSDDVNGNDLNGDQGTWTQDSNGTGALRMLTLWSENDIGSEVDEGFEVRLLRNGIDGIFDAQEEWMDAR